MKNIWLAALCFLLCGILTMLIPTEDEGAIYRDTIRLHILANSDAERDQAQKLAIRDKLLLTYGDALAVGGTPSEAKQRLASMLPQIETAVNEWLSDADAPYHASVLLGTEYYETREYDDVTLPCGRYTSLRVVLGNGNGKNWWCVMFPPLCLDAATAYAPQDDALLAYSDSELRLVRQEASYRVKFKVLEWLAVLCGEPSRGDG